MPILFCSACKQGVDHVTTLLLMPIAMHANHSNSVHGACILIIQTMLMHEIFLTPTINTVSHDLDVPDLEKKKKEITT